MKRQATAVWYGANKDGTARIAIQVAGLTQVQYSHKKMATGNVARHPEELMAVAHADCYTMNLLFSLNEANFTAESLETTSNINFVNGIVKATHLVVIAKIPGIDFETLHAIVKQTEETCLVSRVLQAPITSEITLID